MLPICLRTCLIMAVLLPAMAGTVGGQIFYVDVDANGANDGSGWEDAFNYPQDALAAATSGDEIQVAEGVYKPDKDTAHPNGTGYRTATFRLMNGVALRGSYAGFGETDPNAWDIEAYKTILSGDLGGNDLIISDPENLVDEPTRAENSYHVVTGDGVDNTAVLDGFTIAAGNADGSSSYLDKCGGGMLNVGGGPTVTNCTFIGNYAHEAGGGMYNQESNPTVTECTFKENAALVWGGGMQNEFSSPTVTNCMFIGNWTSWWGAGMSCWGNAPTIRNCTFSGNRADFDGGGMANCESNPMLTNCIFSWNTSVLGGAIENWGSSPSIINCTFTGNLAEGYGGGMYNREYSTPRIVNCTFSGNRSLNWCGGVFNEGDEGGSSPTLTNCILWDNSAHRGVGESRQILGGAPVINYCCIQGWTGNLGGTGNTGADPCFFWPGHWESNGVWIEGDYHLVPDSPCIDAGDNNSVPADATDLDGDGNTAEPIPWDLEGNPRIVDGDDDGNSVVDRGAYEANHIEVAIKFTPKALNTSSSGRWVKVHFVLPKRFGVEDVDANRIAVIWPMGINSDCVNVFINEDNLVESEAAFDRGAFCGNVSDEKTFDVMGIIFGTNGQCFYGMDTIKLINKTMEQLVSLASYWLEGSCAKPDWCGGADLDQDGAVDFVDFALFDSCCIEVVTK